MNIPIDRIGGVICSELKGPMTQTDRLGNRYLVNFVDHKSNYCRVDALLVTGTVAVAVDAFFESMKKLSIKGLGVVSKFLGMRVVFETDGECALDQSEATTEILCKHEFENAKQSWRRLAPTATKSCLRTPSC